MHANIWVHMKPMNIVPWGKSYILINSLIQNAQRIIIMHGKIWMHTKMSHHITLCNASAHVSLRPICVVNLLHLLFLMEEKFYGAKNVLHFIVHAGVMGGVGWVGAA